MADKKLNELGTTENFDNAYVELSQNQYRISKTNLGKQLTKEVHLNFSVASDTPAYIFAQKSDGTNFRISKSDLANALKSDIVGSGGGGGSTSVDTDALYDGCFIMFHDVDGPEIATYADWPNQQNIGEKANGVLIIEGGHVLLVAPHEKLCYWSSKNGTATTTVRSRIKLFDTWDGEERTHKICTDPSSPFYNDSMNSDYAPGYCMNYRINDSGGYWLPCVTELMMIYAHKHKINAGLALISGANQLSDSFYWSSTEYSDSEAWSMDFDLGGIWHHFGKAMQEFCVRPVSTLI